MSGLLLAGSAMRSVIGQGSHREVINTQTNGRDLSTADRSAQDSNASLAGLRAGCAALIDGIDK